MTVSALSTKLKMHLNALYPDKDSKEIITFIEDKIAELRNTVGFINHQEEWNEKDIALITYGDSIWEKNRLPLETLKDFLDIELKEIVSIVHILPFFPYSSDDGFSVIDYKRVNKELGRWEQIENISKNFRLMADLVINHASSKSPWFKAYLKGEAPYTEYFLEGNSKKDYSGVVRPRSHPLLTAYETNRGIKHLWTTFSEDQIDLNFKSQKLLKEMLEILFFYIEKGVRILRLDAIAFLWKEEDTSCIHLPQVHEVVKLIRTIFDAISRDLILLTETNVPDKENLSYFGENNEAHMVYQFTLPPLILHALYTENATCLNKYAKTIPEPGKNQTFFNFTASHDGIGVRPLEGILPKKEVDSFIHGMKQNGAFISEKSNSDGTVSPYEINITYFDACKRSVNTGEEFQIERFLCSQTIMISLQGIPAFYIQSFLACSNDMKGFEKTRQHRTVNRKKWDKKELDKLLTNRDCSTSVVLKELKRRINIRRKEPLFSPHSKQKILNVSEKIFIIRRFKGERELFIVCNITGVPVSLNLSTFIVSEKEIEDLLSKETYTTDCTVELSAYQCCWFLP